MANLTNWEKKFIPSFLRTTHRSPFVMLQELDKAIDYLYHHPESWSSSQFTGITLNPSVDLVDDKDYFKVEAEMPGLDEKDIKVAIEDGILTIRGEKSISRKDEEKNYFVREITYGSYERKIALPENIETDKAKASFKKGMLWITFPKKQGSTHKTAEIKIEKM
jgi:HSP20 family protein